MAKKARKISKKKVKKKKSAKKKRRTTTQNSDQQQSNNSQETGAGARGGAPSPRPRGGRRGNTEVLRRYQFKPGQSGNPKGRPKGSISITARLHKLLRLPVRFPGKKAVAENYNYADLLAEMAVNASANGDFKFFKEIFDRTDGKVPDHVVMESTKRMVAQEAASLAQDLLGLVGVVVDDYLDDDRAEAFMDSLALKFEERFAAEEADQELSEEAAAVAARPRQEGSA